MSLQDQINRLTTQRAAEWFEIVRTGQSDRFPEFIRWATESPKHLEEFLAITALAPSITQAIRAGALDQSALTEPINLPITLLREPIKAEGSRVAQMRGRRRIWLATLAASVASIGLLCFHFLASGQRYSTGIGELRIVQLPDGSMLELNAQSHALVQFGATERGIVLLSGDALFKVARDARRPFRVRAGAALVEAVGTKFAVSARMDGTGTVSVLEGKVRVTRSAALPAQRNTLEIASVAISAGEQARVIGSGEIERHPRADVQSAVAWLRREVVFDHAPLEDVVAEFNKYNQTKRFRLEEIAPGSHHYSGTFRLDDPESLAAFLGGNGDLQIGRRNGEIVISSRQAELRR